MEAKYGIFFEQIFTIFSLAQDISYFLPKIYEIHVVHFVYLYGIISYVSTI